VISDFLKPGNEMKYIVLHSFLIVVFLNSALAQIWERQYGANQNVLSFNLLEDYDHGIVIGGDVIIGGNFKIGYVIKTDINGITRWEKKIGNGSNKWSLHAIVKTSDNGYIIAGATDTLDSHWDPYIMKLNPCGESEWCKIFHTDDSYDYGNAILSLEDGSYIYLMGRILDPDRGPVPWLMHLDPLGNMIWEKAYLTDDSLFVSPWSRQLIITPQQKYLISGYVYYPDSGQVQPWWVQPMLILADSNGMADFEIPWGYALNFGGEGFQSTITGKSNNIFTGISRYPHGSGSGYKPCLIKTSLEGSRIMYKNILDSTQYGKATTIFRLNDTTLVIGAGYRTYDETNYLSAFKVDTNGTVIKEKILRNDEYTPSDAILTSDGKILITSTDIINNKRQILLWKVNQELDWDSIYTVPRTYDSLCPYPITSSTLFFNCDITTSVEETGINSGSTQMKVFPNPGSGNITIMIPEFIQTESETQHLKVVTVFHQWKRNLILQVFDSFGRHVLSKEVRPAEKAINLDVSGWKEGMYFFRLTYNDQPVATAKFVKSE
jgi:hypothetical protein